MQRYTVCVEEHEGCGYMRKGEEVELRINLRDFVPCKGLYCM